MNSFRKILIGTIFGGQCLAAGAISFDITFDDPSGSYSQYYFPLAIETYVAGYAWNDHINSDANLDVRIGFSDIATAEGYSATSNPVGVNGSTWVYEQGAAAQSRTGIDPNGSAPDIYFNFGRDYLTSALWFDPSGSARTAPVPADKIDAISIFLHEFGHALGFNGWRDSRDGSLPGGYQSTFDELVIAENDNLYFIGEGAMREYGSKVPLTFGNYAHLGNLDSQPGADLASDLMNGVALNYGERSFISDLDIAILGDIGVIDIAASIGTDIDKLSSGGELLTAAAPTAAPVPAAVWLFASGLFGLVGFSRFRKQETAS